MQFDDRAVPSDAPAFLNGGGACGALIAARDWSATPLGPIGGWPQSLKTATAILLRSPVPMVMLWGEHGVMIYNDAYSVVAGGRHPELLGSNVREGWAEVADFNDHVMRVGLAGGTLNYRDQELTLHRNGAPERVWMDLDYSPVLGETGEPAGVLAIVIETTERVAAERRLEEARERADGVAAERAAILARLAEGVIVTDAEGRITFVNEAAERLHGQKLLDVPPEGYAESYSLLTEEGLPYPPGDLPLARAVLNGEAVSDARWRIRRPDGSEVLAIGSAQPVVDAGGARIGAVLTARDDTERSRAEEALRASEARLRAVIDAVPVGLVFADADGRVTGGNAQVEKLVGHPVLPSPNVAAYGEWVSFHPDGRRVEAQEYPLARALAGEERPSLEVLYRRGDGRDAWIRFVAAPKRDAEGRIIGGVVASLDIDKERRGELELRALNADLERQVLERAHERGLLWRHSPDLFSVIDMERAAFDRVNPGWTAALGWAADEMEGRPYADFVHPDDIGASAAAFEEVRLGDPVLRFENRYRTREGEWRWLSWVAVAEGGKLYSSTRDVTAEKERDAELAERTAERDRAWHLSQDLRVAAELDGTIAAVNVAWTALLGWSEDELVGRTFIEFTHPDDLDRTLEVFVGVLDAPLSTPYEYRFRHKDGGYRWFAWTAAFENGRVYASGRHTTAEREQAEALADAQEALRQSQKLEAIGQLTGGVAHDFNNLLTVIRGSVELLGRPGISEEKRARYVRAIADTAERATRLTGQLLAFARRQALQPVTFNAGEGVTALAEMIGTLSGSRIEVAVSTPEEACWINADPSQFDTALINMAVNARDAMNGEGRLTVEVRPAAEIPAIRGHKAVAGDFIAVSVTDTGSGIAADQLDRIFEPFFTTKPAGAGTGLGLSQVFGFAKQSAGEIDVRSEPGRGAVFTLFLPRVPAPAGSEGTVALPASADGAGACVLVVEDNDDVGAFAVQALTELGYRTARAEDGEAALAALDGNGDRFDVVFSDVVMPGMSGIELGEEIRRRHPQLPVVLTSGYSHVLARNGTYGFELLHKPYSIEQLARVLGKAAAWREAQPAAD